MKSISLLIIPLLILAPTIAKAMTPAEDGKWQGKADAFANAHDAGAACSKYQANINDNNTKASQCYQAYDASFKQTCLAHPNLMKYRDPESDYATCHDDLNVKYDSNGNAIPN
jgi:hypothetical protein